MSGMLGFFGDTVLVNGLARFEQQVERRAYRLRLLNGSNARIYRLAFSDGRVLTVIGTDGGLLAQPVQRRAVTLAPGERIELWVDFSRDGSGSRVALVSEAFAAGNGAGMGDMMGRGMMNRRGAASGQGAAMDLASFIVRGGAAGADRLPERLAALPPLDAAAAFSGRERVFRLEGAHMRWTINGRTYQHDEVAEEEIVRLGNTEVWAFENLGGMGMMGAQPHPMHVHGVQFRVLERRMSTPAASYWQRLREGLVDEGFKDTVLVLPGERVRVMVRFEAHAGLFLYHCHNLEHEDMGMMRSFRIDA
jgi:FtsP/CotA-like multicopper oxidase with cupredoxin domain